MSSAAMQLKQHTIIYLCRQTNKYDLTSTHSNTGINKPYYQNTAIKTPESKTKIKNYQHLKINLINYDSYLKDMLLSGAFVRFEGYLT
jgi:hypothetical protein